MRFPDDSVCCKQVLEIGSATAQADTNSELLKTKEKLVLLFLDFLREV